MRSLLLISLFIFTFIFVTNDTFASCKKYHHYHRVYHEYDTCCNCVVNISVHSPRRHANIVGVQEYAWEGDP